MAQPRRCFLATLAVLFVFTLLRGLGMTGPPLVSIAGLVVLLALVAAWCGASLADLGLERRALAAGWGYGLAAFAVVAVALTLAAEVPLTETALHDQRGQVSAGQLVYELLVTVVLLTAIPEELAFRGVLLGSAVALWRRRRAAVVTALLFGLWHIQPTLQTMADNRAVGGVSTSTAGQLALVVGAVVVTSAAGLVFAWLRLRSGSLLAPVVAHVATNGIALIAAWAVAHHRLP